ncbi:hypothetical protein NMY22_g11284 [Coprinellus aureogranulatus]|nr:hypothetical protein NMY22_g11284 [Coprinellus aureogranulatus]
MMILILILAVTYAYLCSCEKGALHRKLAETSHTLSEREAEAKAKDARIIALTNENTSLQGCLQDLGKAQELCLGSIAQERLEARKQLEESAATVLRLSGQKEGLEGRVLSFIEKNERLTERLIYLEGKIEDTEEELQGIRSAGLGAAAHVQRLASLFALQDEQRGELKSSLQAAEIKFSVECDKNRKLVQEVKDIRKRSERWEMEVLELRDKVAEYNRRLQRPEFEYATYSRLGIFRGDSRNCCHDNNCCRAKVNRSGGSAPATRWMELDA